MSEIIYTISEKKPKRIVGKYDENHEKLINENYQLSKTDLKKVISSRIFKTCDTDISVNKVNLRKSDKISDKNYIPRTPYFCSGCPHNTSTKIPENSKAMAGIGCHFMSQWMNRNTSLYTHMGAEGAIGLVCLILWKINIFFKILVTEHIITLDY